MEGQTTFPKENKMRNWFKFCLTGLNIAIALRLTCVATVATAQAEPRQSTERNRNYILRRQQAGLVSGTPTSRLIIGKREIDVYRNGLMFEKDHVVGVAKR
jgi:hypothetical protein